MTFEASKHVKEIVVDDLPSVEGISVQEPAQHAWETMSVEEYLALEERMRLVAAREELERMHCTPERFIEFSERRMRGEVLPDEDEALFVRAHETFASLGINAEHLKFIGANVIPLSITRDEGRLLVAAHRQIAANGIRPTEEELCELRDLAERGEGMNENAPLSWALTLRAQERELARARATSVREPVQRIPEWSHATLSEYLEREKRMRTAAASEQLGRIGCSPATYQELAKRVVNGERLSAGDFERYDAARECLRTFSIDPSDPEFYDKNGDLVKTDPVDVRFLTLASKHLAANGVRPTERELATLARLAEQGNADMPLSDIEHVLLTGQSVPEAEVVHVESFPESEPMAEAALTQQAKPQGVVSRLWGKVRSWFRR